jgi:hypothetical protein
MRQQFACSAFGSGFVLFRVIGKCSVGADIPARTTAVSRAAGTPPSRRTTAATHLTRAKTEADTTAASPGTGDPKMSWHAYQPTERTDISQ